MIKNKKKWVLAGLAVMTASALMLGACGSANATSTARSAERTAREVDMVVASVKPIDEKSFNFPAMFGNDFFIKENSASVMPVSTGILLAGDENTSKDGNTIEPDADSVKKSRAINKSRKNGYKSRHFNINKINTENEVRNSYYDKLDDLYVLCADISAANEKINTRLTEIKTENNEMKRLSKELKKSKKAKGDFRSIQGKTAQTNSDLKRLYKDRKGINKQVKSLPRSTDSLNVENMTVRYNAIMNKLDSRLQMLDSIKNEMAEINSFMSSTLNTGSASVDTNSLKTINKSNIETRTMQPKNPVINSPINQEQQNLNKINDVQNEQKQPLMQPEIQLFNANEQFNTGENQQSENGNTSPSDIRRFRERTRIQKRADNESNEPKSVRDIREENRRLERARRIGRSPEQQERNIRHRQGREKPQSLPQEIAPDEVTQSIA